MKFAVSLLVLLPMVYCARIEERFLLSNIVPLLQQSLGSDTSEAACEAACPGLVSSIPFASHLCAPACKELQALINGK